MGRLKACRTGLSYVPSLALAFFGLRIGSSKTSEFKVAVGRHSNSLLQWSETLHQKPTRCMRSLHMKVHFKWAAFSVGFDEYSKARAELLFLQLKTHTFKCVQGIRALSQCKSLDIFQATGNGIQKWNLVPLSRASFCFHVREPQDKRGRTFSGIDFLPCGTQCRSFQTIKGFPAWLYSHAWGPEGETSMIRISFVWGCVNKEVSMNRWSQDHICLLRMPLIMMHTFNGSLFVITDCGLRHVSLTQPAYEEWRNAYNAGSLTCCSVLVIYIP